MNRYLAVMATLLTALVFAAPAHAAFGIEEFRLGFLNEDGSAATQAGSHPYAVVNTLRFNTQPDPVVGELPDEALRSLEVTLPPGLVGRPSAVPQCSEADFRTVGGEPPNPRCPDGTAVGIVTAKALYEKAIPGAKPLFVSAPVWNLAPSPGTVQKLGFWVQGLVPVVIDFSLTQAPPYRVIAKVSNVSQLLPLYGTKLALWGNPANPAHDSERGHCIETFNASEEDVLQTIPGCSIPAGVTESPFVTLGTNCALSLTTNYVASSWSNSLFESSTTGEALTGCSSLTFEPTISSTPTTASGQSSSGLDFGLNVDDEGLTNPAGVAQSDIKRTEVTLPPGMTVNPSLAAGLGACSVADLEHETLDAAPGEGCPSSSKIGTVEVETPLLDESLSGNLYTAKPFENEFNSLLAVYLVIKNKNLGVIVKQAIHVIPDQQSGQLVAIADDVPQLPFSHFHLNFRGGERGPLTTPSGCGTYNAKAVITPWSEGPPVTTNSMFQITTGGGGGGCGPTAFDPAFEAGTLTPLGGTYSPFVLNLSRPAGSARLSSLEATLPEGLLGKLAGVTECSNAQIAAAQARNKPNQGGLELASPSCPASSEVGTVTVGAGSGAQTYVQGRAYLAGPYKGAPLSLVIITPAVTGPFDLGTVVVRNALYVNPTTAQVRAVSDPLPSILEGIPLDIRSISVNLSRPGFTLNPTSCDPMKVVGQTNSLLGQTSPLSSRFQVGGCKGLDFSPNISMKLTGGTKRAKNPALSAVLTQPANQANIDKVSVVLPKSEFIDNRHINNPCTRVQFNEDKCPPKSILGNATAYSPLLDKPLSGPVYFRSNGGERQLPDLVAALHGQIDVNLVGFIDSVKIKGSEVRPVRTRFMTVPDAPVSKFVLKLKGGKRGLLQNSENLCKGKRHAKVKMTAQNNKTHDFNPVVKAQCKKQKKQKKQNK